MKNPVDLSEVALGLEEEKARPRWRALAFGIALAFVFVVIAVALQNTTFTEPLRTRMAGDVKAKQAEVLTKPALPKGNALDDKAERYSSVVQELMSYATMLKSGKASFVPSVSGEEAATQLKCTRLFATAYEELRLVAAAQPNIAAIVDALTKIIEEEQGIDYLMARRLLVTPIAFLRALQNGDLAFPAPAELALTPHSMVAELKRLHPEVTLSPDDATFAEIYRQAREFAVQRAEKAGGVSVYEVIGEVRRAIIANVLARGKKGHRT